MPETVDPDWAKEVLTWWIEHGVAALKINPGARHPEYTFCAGGPPVDAMLEREMLTRRVIGVALRIQNVEPLVRPTGQRTFVELQAGIDLARRALGHLATAAETEQHIQGTSAPCVSG